MDLATLTEAMQNTLGGNLPRILGALGILVGGWIVALIVRAVIRRGLGLLGLNRRIATAAERTMDVEGGLARGAYYLVLLLALIGFFNVLDLTVVSGPLQSLVDRVFTFLPNIAAGVLLAMVAWLLATILRRLATRALAATSLDERLRSEAGMKPIGDNLGNVLYWVVILLFLPGILGVLGLEGLLEPVSAMFDEFFDLLPNALGALVIGGVGWFVARILRDLVANLLSAAGADELGKKAGLGDSLTLSRLASLLVYIFVFVPALIAALDTLQLTAISAPATQMLGTFMDAVPNLLAAAVILAVAWFVSRFVARMATSLLGEMGFDEIPEKIGVKIRVAGMATPSRLAGAVIVFFAMIFATVEAANRLGFTQVAGLVSTFIEFGGQVLLGTVIIAVGLWLANLAHAALAGAGEGNAPVWAGLARLGIIGLVLAMGLRAMGIADEIVTLAFALTLGAVAVAAALSFGLGGREAAGRQMEHWLSRLRKEP